ncbi:hypothetical protein HY992_01065 [Candidatus Micrarchaeota archaeon]|nr:hypothetical protein [Candidatus Micrarchaeota archaeon]
MTAQRGGSRTPRREAILNAPARASRTARASAESVETARAGQSKTTAAGSRAAKKAAKPKPVSVKTTRTRLNKQIDLLKQSLQEKQKQLEGINKRIVEAKKGKKIPAQLSREKTAADAEIQVIQGQLTVAREQLNATYKRKPAKSREQTQAQLKAQSPLTVVAVDGDLLGAAKTEAKLELSRANGEFERVSKELEDALKRVEKVVAERNSLAEAKTAAELLITKTAQDLEAVRKELDELKARKPLQIEKIVFDHNELTEARARIRELEGRLDSTGDSDSTSAPSTSSRTSKKARIEQLEAQLQEREQRLERAEKTLQEISLKMSDFLKGFRGDSDSEKTEVVNVRKQISTLFAIIRRQREIIETLRKRVETVNAEFAELKAKTTPPSISEVVGLRKHAGRMEWLAIGLFIALGASNVGWMAYNKFYKPAAQEQTLGYNDAYSDSAPSGLRAEPETARGAAYELFDTTPEEVRQTLANAGKKTFSIVGGVLLLAGAVWSWLRFRGKPSH